MNNVYKNMQSCRNNEASKMETGDESLRIMRIKVSFPEKDKLKLNREKHHPSLIHSSNGKSSLKFKSKYVFSTSRLAAKFSIHRRSNIQANRISVSNGWTTERSRVIDEFATERLPFPPSLPIEVN